MEKKITNRMKGVRPEGFESPTFGLDVHRSIH